MGSFRNLELCRRPPPCPFGNSCRHVHCSQGKDSGSIDNTIYNTPFSRRTHPRHLNKPEWSTKEESIPSKKDEPEVNTPAPEFWTQGRPNGHHPQITGPRQEIGEDRNMAGEDGAAKSSSTPTMGHHTTSHQQEQGPKHEISGTRFYRVPSFENIDYLTSLTPHHLKGHTFTLKDMGIT